MLRERKGKVGKRGRREEKGEGDAFFGLQALIGAWRTAAGARGCTGAGHDPRDGGAPLSWANCCQMRCDCMVDTRISD